MPLDVVYPYKATVDDAELRYSLRSLTNLPHGDVWIVGDKPDWLTNVCHIPGNRHRHNKPRNVFDNIRLAALHPHVSDRFVVMNDDFFILAPGRLPVEYRCSLAEHITSLRNRISPWVRSLRGAHAWLAAQGITDPLSYELHKPFVADKAKMAEVLAGALEQDPLVPPQWRTVYGNYWRIGGTQAEQDCKRYGRNGGEQLDGARFVSSSESSWPALRPLIEARFPTPSRYEAT